MEGQLIATWSQLMTLKQCLDGNNTKLQNLKTEMDGALNFNWNDPVGRKFNTEYQEKLKPIKKLTDNMSAYSTYLKDEANYVQVYSEN